MLARVLLYHDVGLKVLKSLLVWGFGILIAKL